MNNLMDFIILIARYIGERVRQVYTTADTRV